MISKCQKHSMWIARTAKASGPPFLHLHPPHSQLAIIYFGSSLSQICICHAADQPSKSFKTARVHERLSTYDFI